MSDETPRVLAEITVRFTNGDEMVIHQAELDEPSALVAGKTLTWDDVAANPAVLSELRRDWHFRLTGKALPRDGERGPSITLTRPHQTQHWFSTHRSPITNTPPDTPVREGE